MMRIKRTILTITLAGIPTLLMAIIGAREVYAQSPLAKVSAEKAAKMVIEPKYMPAVAPLARAAHMTALVRLEFTVKPDGGVADIKDLDSAPVDAHYYATTKVAIDAVSLWKFHPYIQDGQPSAMRTSVQFKLNGGPWEVVWK